MKQMLGSLGARWKALTPGRRMIVGLVVAAVLAGGYVAQSQASKTEWGVLYANLDDATASDVMQQLDANGIRYKLDGNGSRILVPRASLANTRLRLAGEGVTGQPVPPGFDEVFAGQGLATSDFEQRVNYERALEGELARTLLAMEPVQGANVQLSLPERSLYIGTGADTASKPTASVLLSLRRSLTGREVDTVANVVSSAVEGLTPQDVTIAATDGQLLQAAGTDAGSAGSTESIEVTREYEQALAVRLTELVRIATGSKAATVEVRADLDFTSTSTERETIDPTLNTPTAEQTSTETYTGTGAGAGGGGAVGIDGGPIDPGTGEGTYSKEERVTEYVPGDRQVTRSQSSAPTVRRLSLAVVVPVDTPDGGTPAAPIDEATIQQLVSSAAGLDAARGDTIALAVVPAVASDEGQLVTSPDIPAVTQPATDRTPLLLGIAGGVAGMGVLMLAMRRRRAKRAKALAAELTELGSPEQLATATAVGGRRRRRRRRADVPATPDLAPVVASADGPVDPDRAAVDEIRADLERMLNESPESLAALLSSWMAK